MTKRKIIIDTDPGIDDTYAIIAALKYTGFDVLGLTIVAGNVGLEPCVNNALGIVNLMDADCSVYPGAKASLRQLRENSGYELKTTVHGESGLGSVTLSPDLTKKSDQHAVDFILETVRTHPDEVEIISLGPMTNLALAIEKDRETMKRVKTIWSMGGGVHLGNRTPVAEFNYWFDPDAVKETYALGEDIEINMIGLDITHKTQITLDDLFFLKTECGETGRILSEIAEHYQAMYWQFLKQTGVIIHDLVAVMTAIDPALTDRFDILQGVNLQVETDGICKGQTVVQKHESLFSEAGLLRNANVYMNIDNIAFKKAFMKLCFQDAYEDYRRYILKEKHG